MFLSRLQLDPRSRQVRHDVANPWEMHRTLWSAFPDGLKESDERILWRLDMQRDGHGEVLVHSLGAPDWLKLLAKFPDYLREPADTKPYAPAFAVNRLLRFRLRANVSVKRDGKRRAVTDAEGQMKWLARMGERNGFTVQSVDLVDEGTRSFRKGEHQAQLSVVRFDGELVVQDVAPFERALREGIGHSKGLGLGLLSIAPS